MPHVQKPQATEGHLPIPGSIASGLDGFRNKDKPLAHAGWGFMTDPYITRTLKEFYLQ